MDEPRCPACDAPAPAEVACDACEARYAPFARAGSCPRCALTWPRLACACGAWTPLARWLPAGHPRGAFLARLEGRDPADGLKAAAARWLGADGPITPERLLVARATLLEAEEVLAAAEAGQADLEALAAEAGAERPRAALTSARAATGAALEKARTALVDARRGTELLGRRALAEAPEQPWVEGRPVAPPPGADAEAEPQDLGRQLLDGLSGLWARGRAALRRDDGIRSYAAHDFEGVVRECSAALEGEPGRPRALALRGAARKNLGDLAGARADLDAALLGAERLSPAVRAWALCERAEVRIRAGEPTLAGEDAAEAERLEPAGWRSPFLRAWARIEAHKEGAPEGVPEEAVEDLDRAVAHSDEATRGWLLEYRAAVHGSRESWARSEADADAALATGRCTSQLYLHRSLARLEQGRAAEGRDDATRALRLAPTAVRGWLLRAWARRLTGDLGGALEDVARLRRHDPTGELTGAWWAQAVGAHLAGEPAQARALLRAGIARTPDEPELRAWAILLVGWEPEPAPAAEEGWSGDVLRFARGELDADALLARARASEDERARRARECQALGLAGLQADRAGREGEALERYRACLDTGVVEASEHAWAQLRLLGAAPPAPGAPVTGEALLERLERLARLREEGVISSEELERLKGRLLG